MKRILAYALCIFALSGCADPIPLERQDYVGLWQSAQMYVYISSDGTVQYKRVKDGLSTTIDAPLQEFNGDDFIVGLLWMNTRFVVSVPPHQIDGQWKMTVDGVELTKVEE
ncbi:hypothetical protein AAEU32_04475 [Pseudoalteromonas sp. SSDWG2]|uniref:hypothetical protein n=1 Tax=Pseudoalteromonas sp. SSDWG2 TaxID=3139391 RepID=UPI003BAB57E7